MPAVNSWNVCFNRMRADDEKLEFVAYLHNEKNKYSGILMMN